MSVSELYTKDTRVWIPDTDKVWKAGKLLSNYKPNCQTLDVLTDDDQIIISHDVDSKLVPNPKLPPLRNPDILIGQNDLTALSYLNEPEVLYNLEVRFLNNNQIYTYCGIVLVAINPYEQLDIYGNEIIQAYNGGDVQNMDPHIFAVSEEAFQEMVKFDHNQSIIVSGESGAGKTVSAKYTMRYFANVGGSSEETQVEKKVLASNPIMEAFGNAKTTRNDNSSRFGKFIQIDFNKSHHIVGASMKTYLLEKSRVVFQATQERNYHIFYQLCSQCDKKEYSHLNLMPATEFYYTNQGDAEEINNVNDNDVFNETLDAFRLLEIKKSDQQTIFALLSAIMHLGNVKIVNEKPNESSSVDLNDPSIQIMCNLLKIDESKMRTWLCNKRIKTVHDVVNTPLPLSQAIFSRDALAKHMYSQLFNWIVEQINKCLKSPVKTHSFIGVLDIYGFETFEINSFEQFCINYANEKLQQQFCQHVFKLEQEEYLREQIKWSFIEFYDNQPCIELIEGKIGILDLLDEECKMPKGSDLTWCNKLYDKHLKPAQNTAAGPSTPQNHFGKPRMSSKAFLIHHFAEKVEYQVDGFLEKNRDTVLEEQLKVLKTSDIDFIAELFLEDTDETKPKGYEVIKRNTLVAPSKTQVTRKKTVGSQFRESLNNLMTALNSTTPHYVRCIKPNDLKSAFKFQAKRAVEQLRACGVLETVRISAAGYPSRWTYQEFFQRYKMLVNSRLINRKAFKETCETILINLIKDQSKYQFGKTKIFFQAGQVAYLEKLRSDKLKSCGIMIQKHIRGWLARAKYVKIQKSTQLIQRYARGLLARRLVKHKRETKAAIIIQSKWRSYITRKNFKKTKLFIIKLQSMCRGYLARQNRLLRIKNIKATIIQSQVRGWLQRKRYQKLKKGIVQLQAHVRRRQTRKIFKTLKLEARSVEHQRQLNKGLENKIISLQQHISKINKERDQLLTKTNELESLKTQVVSLKQFSNIAKESHNKINDLNEELATIRTDYDKAKKERETFSKAKETLEKNLKEITTTSRTEIETLKAQLEEATQKLKTSQTKIDEMKNQLNELENERANHQKLIQEYGKLEQRFEKVRNELLKYSKSNQQNLHSSTTLFTQPASDLESLIEELEQDTKQPESLNIKYSASNTSTLSTDTQNAVNNFESNKLLYMTTNGSEMDVSLISRLNRRISLLQLGNSLNINNEHDNNNNTDLNGDHYIPIERLQQEKDYELIKSQEIELENQKLREDLNRLRDLVEENQSLDKDSLISKEMMDQFDALNEEVKRRREECIHLKSLLVNVHKANKPYSENSMDMNADQDINSIVSNLNYEGNESELRYNSQKILNRVLENQMNELKKKHENEKKLIQKEMNKLIEENERQYNILMKNLSPEKMVEEAYKNEIIKLAETNLELSEKNERSNEEIKKYKKMLKVYIKRSKTMNIQVERYTSLNSSSTVSINGISNGNYLNGNDMNKSISSVLNHNTSTHTLTNGTHLNVRQQNLINTSQLTNNSIYVPQIKSKDTTEYSGYFEWKPEDEPKIITKLIDELKPRLAVTFLPGLPAYVLFMCIRYADLLNDDERVKSLLGSSVQAIKRLIKKKQEDLEYVVLWVTNLCRLIHNLKQYSGDAAFQFQNTPKQNDQCLKNFDLTEYRGILSDIAIWLFQGIIKEFENKLNLIIVPAMLEQESLMSGQTAAKLPGVRANGVNSENKNTEKYTIDSLIKKLNEFLSILKAHGVDPEIVNQIFKQLFYFIGANTFNNLILRKEMCNWSKGINIRYNISQLEQWLRDSKLQDSGAAETLEAVIQASQLLQARKSESDIKSICEMCSKLTIAQVQRILFMYTPLESYEEKLNRTFINKVVETLKEIRKFELNDAQQVLTLDTKKPFSVYIPFNPSNISLETIEIPDQLGLGILKRS